jgi:hypothetical protein
LRRDTGMHCIARHWWSTVSPRQLVRREVLLSARAESAAAARTQGRPLIEELPDGPRGASAAVSSSGHAQRADALSTTTAPVAHATSGAALRDRVGPAVAGEERDQSSQLRPSGLRKGFFAGKKPAKGILKKAPGTQPAAADPPAGRHGPRISPALLHKTGPTTSEQAAFSGVVQERMTSTRPEGQLVSSAPMAGGGRPKVSKFKARMMQDRQE